MPGEFDESKHPRAPDGKFGPGSGSHERTEASLKDSEFVNRHMHRLIGAADKAREGFAAEKQGSDEVHHAAQAAIHREASLIHHEDDAVNGPHADRLSRALDEARDSRLSHEATMEHLATTHREAEDEHAAVSAGHVLPHHEALAPVHEFVSARDEARKEGAAAAADLAKHNDHAADALASFKATDAALEEHDEGHKPLESELDEHLTSTATALDDNHEGFDHLEDKHTAPEIAEHNHEDAPERSQFNTDEEFHSAVADHKEQAATHALEMESLRNEHRTRAEKAQDAFEALHEKQHAALEAFRDRSVDKLKAKAERALDKIHDKDGSDTLVNHAAFAQHERHINEDTGEEVFKDPKVQADHDRARVVAESLLGRAGEHLEEGSDGEFGSEDQVDAIKEAAKSTAHAIKHMSKITGRAPRLSGRTKKSNRPGTAPAANVAPMARYKLRLSKLDFVSLVDQPAQATATVRLIKRAGVRDAVQTQATAKFIGVSKDANKPLAYFWAFTCTGEDGQPYHDLQGDAIEPDAYIKAAEEFMSGGGAVDDMHNGKQSARVAFAFPMDSDIASAMFGAAVGKQVKTSGLMVALRPSAEQLEKLQSGAYTGVSIAGNGIRQLAKRASKTVCKSSVVATSVEAGHAHTIDLCAPASCWGGTLSTSYQTSEGEEQSHSHGWTYDEKGKVTILPDSGHTHDVDGVVSAETMAEAAKDDDDAKPCSVEDKPSGPTVLAISMRSPAGLSTPGSTVPTVKSQEQAMATDQEKIAELEKTNARLEKLASLSDAQRTYHGTLRGQEAEAFLAKSTRERDVVLAEIEKANEVVYESPIDGSKYRKSDDIRLIEMAKRTDEAVAKQRKAEIAERDATFAKRGDETLTNFAKGAKGDLRGRIMKALNAEFTVPAEYEEAVGAMKGMNAAFGELGRPRGFDGSAGAGETNSPNAVLHAAVIKYQTDHQLPSYEQALLKGTESDANIRKLYDAASMSVA